MIIYIYTISIYIKYTHMSSPCSCSIHIPFNVPDWVPRNAALTKIKADQLPQSGHLGRIRCWCGFVYISMDLCVHVDIYIYIYICICMYIYIYVYISIYIHIHIYIYTCLHAIMHCIALHRIASHHIALHCIALHTYIQAYGHTDILAYRQTYFDAYIHITHIYTFIHV